METEVNKYITYRYIVFISTDRMMVKRTSRAPGKVFQTATELA